MKLLKGTKTDLHRMWHESTYAKPALTAAKQTFRFIATTGLALCLAATAQAQTWETVDDIDSGNAYAITTDRAGNAFVAGSINDEAGTHAVVMKSADQGVTWITCDDVLSATSARGTKAIASASVAIGENVFEDHLVTANLATGSKWLIRRSVDAGTTWATLDLYTHPNPQYVLTGPPSVALDSSGNIYAVGSATETITTVTYQGKKPTTTTSTVSRPLLRKLEAGVWRTIALPAPMLRIVCAGSNVFGLSNTDTSWQVRRSGDGGNTWTLVDSFRYHLTGGTGAFDMAADSQGNVFVAGAGIQAVTTGSGRSGTTVWHRYWVVRKGTGGGTAWTTSDVFALGARPNGLGAFNFASAVTVDPNDDVHVTGVGVGADVRHWVTRQLSAGTSVWTTVDDFSLASGYYTDATGIAADPFGNLFATGLAGNSAGDYHGWIVRRRLGQ